jgi:DNA-directed RNA polymerase subunit RPC12/RpoP
MVEHSKVAVSSANSRFTAVTTTRRIASMAEHCSDCDVEMVCIHDYHTDISGGETWECPECGEREIVLLDGGFFDHKYHYQVQIKELDNQTYGISVDQYLSGFAAPVDNRKEAIDRIKSRLNYLSTQPPHDPSPNRDSPAEPTPVSIQTVHVRDETDLAIVAADLVEDQSQIDDFGGGPQPIRTDGGTARSGHEV